ncbi:MAG: hypothetical protein ACK56I_13000, partial [bacterium]
MGAPEVQRHDAPAHDREGARAQAVDHREGEPARQPRAKSQQRHGKRQTREHHRAHLPQRPPLPEGDHQHPPGHLRRADPHQHRQRL